MASLRMKASESQVNRKKEKRALQLSILKELFAGKAGLKVLNLRDRAKLEGDIFSCPFP